MSEAFDTEAFWRRALAGDDPRFGRYRSILKRIPGRPPCNTRPVA